jgi:hypothetical protein
MDNNMAKLDVPVPFVLLQMMWFAADVGKAGRLTGTGGWDVYRLHADGQNMAKLNMSVPLAWSIRACS